MRLLTTEKLSAGEYNIKFKDIILGQAVLDVDGYFYFWDNKDLTGFTASWTLRQTADILDELNKGWDDQINEYFKQNPAND